MSFAFVEEALYESLAKYILNDDDLVENGYPRPSPTKPGTAMIKRRKPLRATTDRKFWLKATAHIALFSFCRKCDPESVIQP